MKMRTVRFRLILVSAGAILLPVAWTGFSNAQDAREVAEDAPVTRSLAYHPRVIPQASLRVAMERLSNRKEWASYRASHPTQDVSIDRRTGRPLRVEGIDRTLELSPRATREEFERFGLDFAKSNNAILRIPDKVTLRLRPGAIGLSEAALAEPPDSSSSYFVIFDLYLGEAQIRDTHLILEFHNGANIGFTLSVLGDRFPSLTPGITSDQAITSAERHVGKKLDERHREKPTLAMARMESDEEVRYLLAWQFHVDLGSSATSPLPHSYQVLVDAQSGEVVEFLQTWLN